MFARIWSVFTLALNAIMTQQALAQNISSTKSIDCIDGPSTWYRGTRNRTQDDVPCQRWDSDTPHVPNHVPSDGGLHNYCRNPDNDLKGVWCYTMSKDKRWDYCDIEKCSDDSLVLWTNYDSKEETSRILSIHADPEIVKTATDKSGSFNVSVMLASNKSYTEFWALAVDYQRQLLFFTDYKSEYVGIRDLKQNKTKKTFDGMAHGIESMTYDWVTKNVYWSDSAYHWVMVVDNSFDYYAPLYKSKDTVHAIAIHSKSRKLFFSTFEPLKAKVYVADLAGKNLRAIIRFPAIFDVTGLTIDYTDDRLYYTDYSGFGAHIFSCALDGSQVKNHHFRGDSIFWSIAAYLDFIYVTDVRKKYDENSEAFYSVWFVPKQSDLVFRYTLPGKPRTIAVYSKNEERSFDKVDSFGECEKSGVPKCDHICLPRIDHRRECACSLGYKKIGDTRCIVENVYDEFLLIADSGQGKLFQVAFNYTEKDRSGYSIVAPSKTDKKVSATAVNPNTGTIYWSDPSAYAIKSVQLGASPPITKQLSFATYGPVDQQLVFTASYVNVDPCTGNIFLLDTNTQSIKLMSSDGKFVKTIFQAPVDINLNISMMMIAQDILYRKIYWTDTKQVEGNGELWRMNYDGTNVELVYKNFNWPSAITVDYHDRDGSGASLFIAEEKTAMIYETPLKVLTTISNATLQSIPKQHDLAAHVEREEYQIVDITVHNGILYLADGKSTNLEKFNLTEGPASLVQFGPSEFFDVTAISVFSKNDLTTLADCILSACTNATCEHICADVGGPEASTAKCLCNNGFIPSGDKNQSCAGKIPNKPPSFGNTCPDDITYNIAECDSYVFPDWPIPQWVNKEKDDDKILLPIIPEKLFEGTHHFSYVATNQYSLSTICSFTVNVVAIRCPFPPELPDTMNHTDLTCGRKFGSSYKFQCVDESMELVVGSGEKTFASPELNNFCDNQGNWFPFPDLSGMKCRKKKTSSGALPGVAIGIGVALAFILLIIVTCGLYRCSKGSPLLIKINFPRIWKRKEDAVTFNNNDNHFVM